MCTISILRKTTFLSLISRDKSAARFLFVLCVLTLPFMEAGCQGKNSSVKSERRPSFVLPEIPSDLKTKEDRLNYITCHYWDLFDFKDTTYIHLPDITEQAIVDYIDLLRELSPAQRENCVVGLLEKASIEPKMLKYMVSVLHEYWVNPQSPFYEETLYEPVARYILSSSHFDEASKSTAAFELRISQMNSVGSVANDFKYVLSSGIEQCMSEIVSPYLLLLFYDPDCSTCQHLFSQIKSSERLKRLIAAKKIKVLAVYPLDDVVAWKKYGDSVPRTWLNACDRDLSIQKNFLYNLVKMPSIYVLDSQKRVLKKDIDIRTMADFLESI